MSGMVKRISAEEARRLLEENPSIFLIDVRQPEEYEKGHIPGAYLIPLPELPDRLSEIKIDNEVVTYCRLGRRSLAGASLIADELNLDVYTIEGGIMAWNGFISTSRIEDFKLLTRGIKTPEEFISLAYSLEEGSQKFYQKLFDHFKEKGEIFKTLANAEDNHKKRLMDTFGNNIVLAEGFSDYMESGISFSETYDRIVQEGRDIKEIIEFSMQVEINSLDLYMKILNVIDLGIKGVFVEIIKEEKMHLKRLGRFLTVISL